MYSDAQIAKLMWEQKTIFPKNWIFGNQYYVIATPVLAAIIYGICGDAILAMGLASLVMTAVIFSLFVWLLRPFASEMGLVSGLFAIGGAVILGISACSCTTGMQLFYTMASYYACYLIGILLVLGVYLRLIYSVPMKPAMPVLAFFAAFCLGIQSLRETLVLVIPLACVAVLYSVNRRSRRGLGFTFCMAAANIAGLFVPMIVKPETHQTISDYGIPHSAAYLWFNIRASASAMRNIMGFQYFGYGLKWYPLGIAAVLISILCAFAVFSAMRDGINAVRRREQISPISMLILFCVVSLFSVFAVGVFLSFSLRGIYFFVWYLLTALSFVYVIENTDGILKTAALLLLLGCGALNLFYNAYTDVVQHDEQEQLFAGTADMLVSEGYDRIYIEYTTYYSSAVAACSDGRIEAAPIMVDASGVFAPFPTIVNKSLFADRDAHKAAIILMVSHLSGTSSLDTVYAAPDGGANIFSKLELISVESNRYNDLYIYRILDPTVLK